MTQLRQDLWKIAFDKGLLALVAIGVGFYFSRLLERYKARTTYLQKLADRRLDAFEKLATIIHDQLTRFYDIAWQLEHFSAKTGPDAEKRLLKLRETFDTFSKSFERDVPNVIHINGVYLTPRLSNYLPSMCRLPESLLP